MEFLYLFKYQVSFSKSGLRVPKLDPLKMDPNFEGANIFEAIAFEIWTIFNGSCFATYRQYLENLT